MVKKIKESLVGIIKYELGIDIIKNCKKDLKNFKDEEDLRAYSLYYNLMDAMGRISGTIGQVISCFDTYGFLLGENVKAFFHGYATVGRSTLRYVNKRDRSELEDSSSEEIQKNNEV